MRPYRPARVRRYQGAALLLRALSALISLWPLWAVAALLVSPVGPHWRFDPVQWSASRPPGLYQCGYVGSRGRVWVPARATCPLILIIDRRAPGR